MFAEKAKDFTRIKETKMRKIIFIFLAALLLICVARPISAQNAKLKIAVIPKGTTHLFWKSVEAGARKAEAELGVEIIWKGPLKENDRAQQIAIVEQFVTESVSGIVLAPLDDAALVRPVSAATQKKIPVVIFDSALKGEAGKDFVSFVATNNKKGGNLGGEQLAILLGGKGKIVLLRYQIGSASTVEREAGFVEALGKNPDIKIISDNRYAGATAGEAKTASMNMLDKIREAGGIFCPNESSTFGMLLALRQTNLAGKIKFVGFDTSPPLVEALEKGEIDALVAQDPTRMGYEGVKTLVEHIRGKQVPAVIDTGVRLITRENFNTPEIKKLLGRS
jgi:ribose transport system substrate-binding protein